ncbi:uncharacterized protein BJX67DRAFT_383475 [Aspergillus lucknowensis]|uniref:Uncharacterized protein n=1 Tax=Aspergillus lucknowensis TaxID=176173 RepID=A0ABR4LK06_9EURO
MALRIPIPAVLCGRLTTVGKAVSQSLRPEFEVIHFINSPAAAHAELPRLFAGQHPQPAAPNDIGTANFAQPPRVVIFGRGYSPEFARELKSATADSVQMPVAWVAGEPSKAPSAPPAPGYTEKLAGEVKGVLATWMEEGGLQDAFILY